jgi:2-oxoisovalerate dehydrogenase E1 component
MVSASPSPAQSDAAGRWVGLGAEAIREAYQVALATRVSIITAMALKTRGEGVEFWIGGPGEEVHGVATALALDREVRKKGGEVALFCHYRSDALAAMQSHVLGRRDYFLNYFRQALSRVTDPHSGGRQMAMHLCMPELGLMPMQSPVGMQLGKAAGYARGFQILGKPGLAVAILGDGTTAESDLHEASQAAALWNLPLLILITDNRIAISVTPEDGRGIKSYERYAEAFGLAYFTCDGHDLLDTYRVTRQAAQLIREEKRAAILQAIVPRLMGHSSSSGGQFDYDARDPLLEIGDWLVEQGICEEPEVCRRLSVDKAKSYFDLHRLGSLLEAELGQVREAVAQARGEASPSEAAGDVWRFAAPPHPRVEEPAPLPGTTRIQYNEALNLALDRALSTGKAALWGQDVGRLGGVFQVTAGLLEKYPELVRDAPLNEPLILGTAVGCALHSELALFPEIQFGDYSLNCLHWLVHLGNLHWTTHGQVACNVTLRTPVDPVQGGAVYHSMSVDGFYGHVPGLVITIPSTSHDAYGLLRTATQYPGPVLQLEPKRLYRMKLGPPLPGEPTEADAFRAWRRSGNGLAEDYAIPFGKAVERRAGGDVTVVSWGWGAWQSTRAAEELAAQRGVQAQVLDLRTLVPYDWERIAESARRTGRVLIVQNDRTFAGFGRQIQGEVVERLPGVIVRVVGQLDTPAVGQARSLEDAITLSEDRIRRALIEIATLAPAAWLENELHWLGHAPLQRLT